MDRDVDTVWLVRHGESTWNALGLVQGQVAEPALTLVGMGQARQVAGTLARSLADRPVRALYCSDLQRAVQTALPVATALGRQVVQDPRLRERGFGDIEGLPSGLLCTDHSGLKGEQVVDADAAPPGGESVRDLYRRAAAFGEEVLAGTDGPGGDIVVVAHGGLVRVLLAWLDGVTPDGLAWGPVGNGFVVSRPLSAARRASMPVA